MFYLPGQTHLSSHSSRHSSRQQLRLCCTLGLAVAGLLLATVCHAAPATTPAAPSAPAGATSAANSADEMGSFLADKGLVAKLGDQLGQAGRAVSNKASDLVVNAMGFLGVPYQRGGNSYEQGFDCSGFVRAMYEQTVGLVLPRRSAEQAAATQPIDKSELQPGDLVFFNTMRAAFSHVGIYVGDNKFIHSPRSGGQVRVEDMRIGYWSSRFNGARRVETPDSATGPAQARPRP